MRIVINALSVTNTSGRHVLLGHLSHFAKWTADRHEYVVLHHGGNEDIRSDLGPNVSWIRCPDVTARTVGRGLWEVVALPALVRRTGGELLYSPAGTTASRVDVPQVSFAQNPWALVPTLERTVAEKIKAALQRRAYRTAMKRAVVMVFNSHYMHEMYRHNAGHDAQRSEIIYQGVNDSTFDRASHLRQSVERNPHRIVSVSAMAPHKGVETLVAAVSRLRREHDLPATLDLIGAWPDSSYRKRIEKLIADLGLEHVVSIRGHVSREELDRAYAGSMVFSLMSWCESFGIPAVEAQAFGTPVVSSNCCAIPEVCGPGGTYPAPGDDRQVAEMLARVMTDSATWETLSAGALENVERYRWERCSRPYVELFDSLAG